MALIRVCDVCGETDRVCVCSYWVDRRMDAAGSMSDEHETFDLCLLHRESAANGVIKKLVKNAASLPHKETGPLFVEVIKSMIKGFAT